MVEIGYSLSSEEHGPRELCRLAAMAEDTGFAFAMISDHYHPWITNQGHSPFVWATLGGIARSTDRLRVGTGVTCPIIRVHPAIVAQAAATVAEMFEGRFMLGLGAGENLNEHILGDQWPPPPIRHEMLLEAIEIMRALWEGEEVTHYGQYYTVDEAKLFTLPPEPPPILVAADGPKAAELAGGNDGLVAVSPQAELISAFESAGGSGKPRYGQVTTCYDEDERRAAETMMHYWPTSGLKGNVNWELKTVELFDQLVGNVREDDIVGKVPLGPDPGPLLEKIRGFIDAGFDHVYIHQVGPNQEGFIRWAEREILPQFQAQAAGARGQGGLGERQLPR